MVLQLVTIAHITNVQEGEREEMVEITYDLMRL